MGTVVVRPKPFRLLDKITGASAAYSVRRLSMNYSGSALRVRRSLDSAELDVGFDTNGDLDTTALMNFVGYQNLLPRSEEFANSAWFKEGFTVTANTVEAPDGRLTADTLVETATNVIHRTYPNGIAVSSGATVTASVYLRAGTRRYVSVIINNAGNNTWVNVDTQTWTLGSGQSIGSGVFGSASINDVGGGWRRVSITGSLTGITSYFFIVAGAINMTSQQSTYLGDGSTIILWGAQLNIGSTAQPYSSTSPRNLLTFTESFDNAAWSKTRVGIVANATTAPDGTLTADKVVDAETSSAVVYTATQPNVVSMLAGEVYTVSAYAKRAEKPNASISMGTSSAARCQVNYNFDTGVITNVTTATGGVWSILSSGVESVGNGWFRLWITGTCLSPVTAAASVYNMTTNTGVVQTGTINDGTFYWGVQLEAGSTATTYQRVASAWSATRDGNGFVATWYDQSGNARNLTQATAANQPSIVTSGVIVTDSGRPAIQFDGTNDVLSSASFINSVLGNSAFTFSFVSGGTNNNFGWTGNGVNGAAAIPRLYLQRNAFSYNNNGTPSFSPITGTQILSMQHDGVTTTNVWRNGSSVGTATEPVVASFTGGFLSVPFYASALPQAGLASEAVLFAPSLSTTNRQILERNQGRYFGITIST